MKNDSTINARKRGSGQFEEFDTLPNAVVCKNSVCLLFHSMQATMSDVAIWARPSSGWRLSSRRPWPARCSHPVPRLWPLCRWFLCSSCESSFSVRPVTRIFIVLNLSFALSRLTIRSGLEHQRGRDRDLRAIFPPASPCLASEPAREPLRLALRARDHETGEVASRADSEDCRGGTYHDFSLSRSMG